MGGSFNPPHNGHVYIAREVRRRFSLDRVLFMVAGDPPHKSIAFGVDAKERLDFLEAYFSTDVLISNSLRFSLTGPEINHKIKGGGSVIETLG